MALLTQAPAGYEPADVSDLKNQAQEILSAAVDREAGLVPESDAPGALDPIDLADRLVELVLDAVRPEVEGLLTKEREVTAALIDERRIAHTSTLGYADGWNDALTLAAKLAVDRAARLAA